MLVSLRWLANYVSLPISVDELANRLSLSGLNHESTTTINGDTVFDLEVTSNRGDCLGHIGVAREISVLYDKPLCIPEPDLAESGQPIESLLSVQNQFPEACPRYTARLIRDVKITASPDWMIRDLQSVFSKTKPDGSLELYKPINNVVDATNYVLMETGSPLHAFDYDKLSGKKIIIRRGRDGETMTAIDHRDYVIDDETCVIADAESAQAIAGVMGGFDSEVSSTTTNVVIEAATFTPLSIRRTARRLKLHSPSSFRFERKVDAARLDQVSRRVCELICRSGRGTLAPGMLDTHPSLESPPAIQFKLSDIERVLGIAIGPATVSKILTALGCAITGSGSTANDSATQIIQVSPPSWRADLTRGADLIEEVARIHGYDKIPEDAPVPVTPSLRREFDDATDRLRQILIGSGMSEAMTPSVVADSLDEQVSPWTDSSPLRTITPMLKGARTLRRSILPSLIESRAYNWSAASLHADLFEIAHLYLPDEDNAMLPRETYALSLISGQDYRVVKGIVSLIFECLAIHPAPVLEVLSDPKTQSFNPVGFQTGSLVRWTIDGEPVGYLGKISAATTKSWKLTGAVVAAELSLPVLLSHAQLVPQQKLVSAFPSIRRDLNFVVSESVRWADLETVAKSAIGSTLVSLHYQETYRDADRDGDDRKRLLMSVELQKPDATMSGDEADELVNRLIKTADAELSAKLLS